MDGERSIQACGPPWGASADGTQSTPVSMVELSWVAVEELLFERQPVRMLLDRVRTPCDSASLYRNSSASADQAVRIWDAQDGRLLVELKGDGAILNSAAFSPDG